MSNNFDFRKINNDIFVFKRNISNDNRGSFDKLFCDKQLEKVIGKKKIKQINSSFTKKKGCFRGFHYQTKPYSEIKIVTCLEGEVLDIVVDMRKRSKNYLSVYYEKLTACNYKSIVIPEGFAHGFQSLTKNCKLLYLHTNSYEPKYEAGLNVYDKKLNIKLPLKITEISDRDKSFKQI